MDPYIFSLILGLVGLAAMAVTGIGRHGSGGHGGHGGHGGGHAGHGGSHAGHGSHAGAHGISGGRIAGWALMSPRLLFAALIGFGLAGIALRSLLGGTVLLLVAILAGIVVERLFVNPLWNFAMRFASNPALTIESATFSEARVVSNFDHHGQGIIALEVDGQVQQILATLSPEDRANGARVRAGQLVRVDEVDGARHRCIVSVL
ncbi:MAG TPA: hypothetical protein VGM77_02455 [Gemmatimonadales bacterium]|jgi:hypothetical protein